MKAVKLANVPIARGVVTAIEQYARTMNIPFIRVDLVTCDLFSLADLLVRACLTGEMVIFEEINNAKPEALKMIADWESKS